MRAFGSILIEGFSYCQEAVRATLVTAYLTRHAFLQNKRPAKYVVGSCEFVRLSLGRPHWGTPQGPVATQSVSARPVRNHTGRRILARSPPSGLSSSTISPP